MQLPIKVLKDKDQNPFIPFVTTSSVVENGTNRNLDDILHNLTVPVTNLNSLENTAVADMMTNMKDYKDSGFAIIYVNTDNTGLLLAFEKITTVDVLNKCWSFVSSFNADSKAYRINITGYYNADNSVFTVSSATIEELVNKVEALNYYSLNGFWDHVSTSGSSSEFITDEASKTMFADFVNTVYNREDQIGMIDLYSMDANENVFHMIGACKINKQKTRYEIYLKVTNGYSLFTRAYSEKFGDQYITIDGTWADNIFTLTRLYLSRASSYGGDIYVYSVETMHSKNGLLRNNSDVYTPTGPYNPATKKYVDDVDKKLTEYINSVPAIQDLVDNGFDYNTHTIGTTEITTTMTNISTTYGFALNDKGYYESNNKKKASSYALCKVTINAPVAFTLTIPYINSGESNYDYGIFGQLDTELANSVADDGATGSAKVKLNCKGQASADVKQVSYDIPAGEHFIEIKYRKDNSGDQGNDSLQFKIDATFSVEQEIFVNKKLATTDILDTLPTMSVYYISAYNVMGTDVDITDAETLAQVNEIINSNYGKDVLLCIKDKTYRGYYMFLVMFWTKPTSNRTNTYKVFSTISLIQTEDSHRALTVLPMKFTYNTVAGEGITVTHIKYDTLNGNKKNEYILLEKFYTRIPGYNSSKTQVLKNVNGTLKWVTEEVA